MSKHTVAAFLSAFLLGLFSVHVKADTITYDDLESSQMFFSNVTESSVFDALPLFGAPAANGSFLEFNNPEFIAIAGENSLDFVDGRVTATVTAKDDRLITGFEFLEYGSYLGTGTDLDIFVSGIGFATADGELYQSDFQFTRTTAGEGEWEGSFFIEFLTPVTSFSFVADNQLFARGGAGSTALVDKENVTLDVHTIPEPTSTIMILGAALSACLIRRR